MTYIKELRIALRLTQKEFADILGIKRAIFAMIEVEHRELPSAAAIKLNTLERDLFFTRNSYTINDMVPELETYRAASIEFINKHKEKTRSEYDKLCDDFKEMKEAYRRGIDSLYDVRRMIKVHPDTRSKEHKYLLNAEETILKTLEKNGLNKQYLIELCIDNCKNIIAKGLNNS